jgi:hypothetical protein
LEGGVVSNQMEQSTEPAAMHLPPSGAGAQRSIMRTRRNAGNNIYLSEGGFM